MKILVLGGTLFVGRHLVEAALARGHEVTLFNRGQTNPDLFPEVEKLKGDRSGDLSALRGRRWDAVVDPSGHIPRHVRASAELLADAVDHYSFVSTINVYADVGDATIDENWKLATLPDESSEERTGGTSGGRKALCERIVEEVMPGRALNYRPALIVGPHDPSDRFTYWVRRVSQGGKVLVPGYPERPQQIIDVRDMAEWNIRMAESGQGGVYTAGGPDYRLTMGHMLDECKVVTGSDAEFVWVGAEFFDEQGERSYSSMPPWPDDPLGLMTINCEKIIKAGLTFRPLADTISDTLKWDAGRGAGGQGRKGPSLQREKDLLEAWSGR